MQTEKTYDEMKKENKYGEDGEWGEGEEVDKKNKGDGGIEE